MFLFTIKMLRGFIYGIFSVSLILFLIDRGNTPIEAGIAISFSIIFSSIITFLVTFKYHVSRGKIFLEFMSMLLLLGILLLLPHSLILNDLGAILGGLGVNPSDNTIFSSFEQPLLSVLTTDQNKRNRIFSQYTLIGYIAASMGSYLLFVGIIKLIYVSVIFALLMILLYPFIKFAQGTKKVELKVSENARKISRDVSILFSLDALGGGFVLQSLIAYWFKIRYGLNLQSLGIIFSIIDIIIGISILVTPYISKKIGLLRTMVYSHLPSNVFLLLIPLVPSLYLSLLFLFLRYSLSQMDVPTRQSYLNSIVSPDERSYVVGMSNASRSVAQSLTPYISSYLIPTVISSLPFVLGGGIKIIYDISLYSRFKNLREKY